MRDAETPRYCVGDAAKKLLFEKAHYAPPPYRRCGTCKYFSSRTAFAQPEQCLHPDVCAQTEYGAERPYVDRCGVCDNYEAVSPEDLGNGTKCIILY